MFQIAQPKWPRFLASGVLTVAAALSLAPAPADAQPVDSAVTFAKDVAPILQAKCQDCHRAGSMAPMSLVTFEETRPWARSIKERVSTRQMPPWHIDRAVGVQKFKNDMSLSDEQVATIVRWVEAIRRTCPSRASGLPTTSGRRQTCSVSRTW